MHSKSLQDISFSILDLATVAEGRSIADTYHKSLENAQQAEKLGYTRYWFAEHHNMISVASSATSLLISYIAGNTGKIRVGSGGIMLPNHSPLVIAEQFGTLETLYPGRIDLGLGRAPGTDQTTAMAIRRQNMDAAFHFQGDVEALQQYFSASNHDNKVRAIPGEGLDIPIWILGSSTDSARLAAAKGLPYAFASHFAPSYFKQAIAIYRDTFKPSAQLAAPYVMACVNVVVADTDKEAEYLSSSVKQMFRGIITGKRQLLQPPVESMENIWNPLEEAAAMEMLTYSFVGSKETIQSKLSEFLTKNGLDEIMATAHIYDHQARLKSFRLLSDVLATMKQSK